MVYKLFIGADYKYNPPTEEKDLTYKTQTEYNRLP